MRRLKERSKASNRLRQGRQGSKNLIRKKLVVISLREKEKSSWK